METMVAGAAEPENQQEQVGQEIQPGRKQDAVPETTGKFIQADQADHGSDEQADLRNAEQEGIVRIILREQDSGGQAYSKHKERAGSPGKTVLGIGVVDRDQRLDAGLACFPEDFPVGDDQQDIEDGCPDSRRFRVLLNLVEQLHFEKILS